MTYDEMLTLVDRVLPLDCTDPRQAALLVAEAMRNELDWVTTREAAKLAGCSLQYLRERMVIIHHRYGVGIKIGMEWVIRRREVPFLPSCKGLPRVDGGHG